MTKGSQKIILFIEPQKFKSNTPSKIGNFFMNRLVIDEDESNEILKIFELKNTEMKYLESIDDSVNACSSFGNDALIRHRRTRTAVRGRRRTADRGGRRTKFFLREPSASRTDADSGPWNFDRTGRKRTKNSSGPSASRTEADGGPRFFRPKRTKADRSGRSAHDGDFCN